MSHLQPASTMLCLVSFWAACAATGCGDAAGSGSGTPSKADGSGQSTAASELSRVEQYVASLHSPADIRHTFQSEQGETIECVDYYSQASVKARLAAGESMADVAPPNLTELAQRAAVSAPDFAAAIARIQAATPTRDGNGSLRQCPAGSVPSLRPTVNQILHAGGLDAYLTHALSHPRTPLRSKVDNAPSTEPPGYMHVEGEYNNHSINGGVTTTSVYDPGGSTNSFIHSLSQSWFTAGTVQATCSAQCTSNCEQSIEVGWEVEPSFYPDENPHLFVFTTPDGYWTDCQDERPCAVLEGLPTTTNQYSSVGGDWAPGEALSASNIGTTPPNEIELVTFGYQGEWYVLAGPTNSSDYLMGEIPSSFYAGGPLAEISSATNINASYAVGGEVEWDDEESLVPVNLGMGVGVTGLQHFSTPYGVAAYHRNVGLLTYDFGLGETTPAFDATFEGDSNCYDMQTTDPGASGWGNFFYFGGLGQVCFGSACNACCSSSDSACNAEIATEENALQNGCVQ
jgi:hypothetical protein